MEELTISEVARQAGVAPSTIRYYESINLLPAPRRVGGRRRYEPAVLERLAFIRITQQLGFSLGEIERLFQQPASESPLPELWQSLARQKLSEVDRLIKHAMSIKLLLRQGLRCNCPNLHDCINCVLHQCDSPQPV